MKVRGDRPLRHRGFYESAIQIHRIQSWFDLTSYYTILSGSHGRTDPSIQYSSTVTVNKLQMWIFTEIQTITQSVSTGVVS